MAEKNFREKKFSSRKFEKFFWGGSVKHPSPSRKIDSGPVCPLEISNTPLNFQVNSPMAICTYMALLFKNVLSMYGIVLCEVKQYFDK